MDKKDKQTKPQKKSNHKVLWIVIAVIAVVFFLFLKHSESQHNAAIDREEAKTERVQKAKKAKKDKARAKKQAAKKAAEEQHYKNFQQELKELPGKTDNLVTSAKVEYQGLHLTINDDALAGTDAQTKALVRQAWKVGMTALDNFEPMPDSKIHEHAVYVDDSAGNQLAETSAFLDFKYTNK